MSTSFPPYLTLAVPSQGPKVISGTTEFTDAVTFTGGVVGCRQLIPFGELDIAAGDNATPASSTPVRIHFCGVTSLGTAAFVAMRDGSVTGLSVKLNAAAAGSSIIFGVYKNGTIINASAIVTIATSGTSAHATFTLGSYTFVAGDVLDVRVRTGSGWSATSADAAVMVEVST